MGRTSVYPVNRDAALRFRLVRVRLDSGGYDSGGAYWGFANPLYWAFSLESVPTEWRYAREARTYATGRTEPVTLFRRGTSRADVKAQIVAECPGASFLR